MIEKIHDMVTKAHNDWMGFIIDNSKSPVEAQAKYNDLKDVYITEILDSIEESSSLEDFKEKKNINELCRSLVDEISGHHFWDEITDDYTWDTIQQNLTTEVKGLNQLSDPFAK